MKDAIILTDCDGVLLNWEYAFSVWVKRHYGITPKSDKRLTYNLGEVYGIPNTRAKSLIVEFNESAAIGFLPPLRDAVQYVKKLNQEHGFMFHVITSLSTDPDACSLRYQNLEKVFGNVFTKVECLETGIDKHEALEPFKNSGCFWIEDKVENYQLGKEYGLNAILMEHGHNMHLKDEQIVKNWADIYGIITQS